MRQIQKNDKKLFFSPNMKEAEFAKWEDVKVETRTLRQHRKMACSFPTF